MAEKLRNEFDPLHGGLNDIIHHLDTRQPEGETAGRVISINQAMKRVWVDVPGRDHQPWENHNQAFIDAKLQLQAFFCRPK